MTPIEQRIIAIIFSITLVIVTVQLIRKRKLREEYALGWLAVSLSILILSVFEELVTILARLVSVTYPPTLILVVGILFSLVVLLSQSVALSAQADSIRDLAQKVTLLEWQLNENKTNRPKGNVTSIEKYNSRLNAEPSEADSQDQTDIKAA